ncbi:putative dithiol-disulfide oxidoreductase (DUF899 family) [Pseudonocardia hierapolitana]|uniref:Putative dithiol-disulfide oxidoreductase (DUF899 family) n=2 Tax=Pseudonocardia hierapolitana TaxID=1128676 RepID=A0A561SHG3_9PSEU|nr:putative dithiol-disulfide oxidoreductase (DUF899 family) [Pseudonocardia hierapolitana]
MRKTESTTTNVARPPIASPSEWRAARMDLLAAEKEVTRARDALAARRRRLPMVRIGKDYRFEGPDGVVGLADLFAGHTQLYVHHFMWLDEPDTGCPSCTRAADRQFNEAHFGALRERNVAFAAIARAPWPSIRSYRDRRGWTFPFFSSHGSDFNYDFHVTLDESRAPVEYNYRTKDELIASGIPAEHLHGDWPGASVFLRDGDTVHHTYSAYARGLDGLATAYQFLDLTVYGRQEAWEDSPDGWPQDVTSGP